MNEKLRIEEFICKCGCKQHAMKPAFVEKLCAAREDACVPFKINSGYRCQKQNIHVKGSPNSSHLTGWAADIHCTDPYTRILIVCSLIKQGLRRIGIAETFIHVDDDPTKHEAMWRY